MIEYRPATRTDSEDIGLLHARSWRENYRGSFADSFLDHDLPDERLREWSKRLQARSADQFVQLAIADGRLVGFICVYGHHDPCWGSLVDNLHVAAEYKRHGIGRSLMRQAGTWLESYYPDLGVYLWVLESNSRARAFYESIGGGNAGVTTMESHGKATVRSCRYVWSQAKHLAHPEVA